MERVTSHQTCSWKFTVLQNSISALIQLHRLIINWSALLKTFKFIPHRCPIISFPTFTLPIAVLQYFSSLERFIPIAVLLCNHAETQRQTQRLTQRQTNIHKHTDTQRNRQKHRDRQRQRDRQKHTDRPRNRQKP